MRRLGLFALFLLVKTQGWSQSATHRQYTREELLAREEALMAHNSASSATIAVMSLYFGYDAQIKNITRNGLIPSDFPKATKDMSKEKFIEEANAWVAKNPTAIKPEHVNYNFNDNTK